MSLKITKDNFESEVLNAKVPVLLDFWAPWCGPCKMIGPVIDLLADEVKGKAVVGKINVDEQPELASQFNVMSIPTIAIVKNGKVQSTSVGVKSKEALKEMLGI